MASTLSHKSVVEICTFIRRYNTGMPNTEWRFAAEHCVAGKWGDPEDLLPAEYLSSDGFRISAGKYTLSEAVDAVFSPGDTPLILTAAQEGFIEGILERYRRACKETFVMRTVRIQAKHFSPDRTDLTDLWINAYYTSFPCYRCSGCDGAEHDYEVFHLTPPDAHQCLSLKYTHYRLIEIVNCTPHCHGIGMPIRQLQQKRPVLRSVDLRHEAFQVLPRVDLDTCLLVNRLWSAQVNKLSPKLALRELRHVKFTYLTHKQSLCFYFLSGEEGYKAIREFTIPRNATVDCAIAVNHLRNCTSDFIFDVHGYSCNDNNLELPYSVRLWINNLLSSMKDFNFRFNGLYLWLGRVNPAHAVDFFFFSSFALRSNTIHNGLRKVSLVLHEADLFKERFLQLPYVQNLEHIELSIAVFGPDPPVDHSWIRGLFQLPNCQQILVKFTPRGQHKPDCSEQIVGVLRETVKHFENATDVSGFPDIFEFVVKQRGLTWDHQEPTPTYSDVPVPFLDGLWNVYVSKNRATNVPLSVYMDTEENCQGDRDERIVGRSFIFRKEPYANPHPPPSAGKPLCQLAEEFLILFTSVEARYHAIIEYVLRLRYKRSTEAREKLKDRLEMVLVDGVTASHFGKNPDCDMEVLEAYEDVCNGGFTMIQQDLPGLMDVFEAHALQAQVIRANEVFSARVVENVRDFCRKLKAVNFPIVEDMLEAILRCLFKHVYGPKDFAKVWLGAVELIRREFAEFCVDIA